MCLIQTQKKEKKKNIDNELKTVENMREEKNNFEKQLSEVDKQENIIKKNIDKNEKIILRLSNDIKYSEKKIEMYLNERNNLIQKSNIPKKSRDKLKYYENEIRTVKKIFCIIKK